MDLYYKLEAQMVPSIHITSPKLLKIGNCHIWQKYDRFVPKSAITSESIFGFFIALAILITLGDLGGYGSKWVVVNNSSQDCNFCWVVVQLIIVGFCIGRLLMGGGGS